jgi:hypothetical protein
MKTDTLQTCEHGVSKGFACKDCGGEPKLTVSWAVYKPMGREVLATTRINEETEKSKIDLDKSLATLSATALRVKRERDLLLTAVHDLLRLNMGHVDCKRCGGSAEQAVKIARDAISKTV